MINDFMKEKGTKWDVSLQRKKATQCLKTAQKSLISKIKHYELGEQQCARGKKCIFPRHKCFLNHLEVPKPLGLRHPRRLNRGLKKALK